MKLLLLVYPRRWRERYGDELLALLEGEPLTWRVRADVAAGGLRERVYGSGRPELKVLWAWSLFVIGGMAFQKTSEHWQTVVPGGSRTIPAATFDTVQTAAAIGTAAVLAGVGLALPAFLRDLRSGGWAVLRRPIVIASSGTAGAAAALVALGQGHGVGAAAVFIVAAVFSLFAWTRAAAIAARRLDQQRVQSYLALTVTAAMAVMTVAAAVWFASVSAHAPSFVGTAQLALAATFMLVGMMLASTACFPLSRT
jgi:hypothetical protein